MHFNIFQISDSLFIVKVKILESMDSYERSTLSDAFVEEKYKAGE
jgi:hypothetical protein